MFSAISVLKTENRSHANGFMPKKEETHEERDMGKHRYKC